MTYQLLTANIDDLDHHIADDSVDWIITDPPYPYEFIETFSLLSHLASRVLTRRGGLIVMSGQTHLPEVMERLGAHMQYHWMCAYHTPGGQAAYVFPRKVNPFWKPLLLYRRRDGEWSPSFGDVIKTSVNNNDKAHHHWGQSVEGFENIIKRFTQSGDTILDPFVGGGTTGLAAVRSKRVFIGSDVDEKCIATSRVRLDALIREMEQFRCLFGTPMA